MDLSNTLWHFPSILHEDSIHGSEYGSQPQSTPTMQFRESTETLTDADIQQKGKVRKDSKRGSGASTPRDGVAGFLHDGADGASRAASSVTPSVTSTPFPNFPSSTPVTPKSVTTFDAKSLLSPKTGKGSREQPAIVDDDDKDDAESGGVNFYEKLYRVEDRTEAPGKRRKLEAANDDIDEPHKKSKFEIKGGSDVMSDFIRNEKQKDVDEIKDGLRVAGAIDLTDDKSQPADEKVPIKPEDDVLVVLGKLELDGGRQPQAIMNNVPYMRPNGMWKVATKNPAWPPIPVRLVQEKGMLIKVVDPIRQRFASLDALSAQAIAPLMENSNLGVTFKVTVPSRKRKNNEREGDAISDFAILQLKILAPRSKAKAIGKFLSQKRAWLRNCPVMHSEILYNPHDPKTFATTSSVSLAVVPGSSSTAYNNRTVEEIRTDVLNMFDSIIRTEHLPEAEKPANIKTELLSHQKQALFFLTEREEDRIIPKKDGGEVFHLWKSKHAANGKTVYYNVITGTELPTRPPLMRGGILADVMGLGKTLSILSLVVASMSEARKFAMCPPPIAHNARLKTNAHSTLLICPLSVVANWEIQLKDHIKPDSVKCYIYHGPTRTKDPQELRGHDIVITSYHTVANDLKYHNSPLFQIHWFRVVLDEAHIIRNPAAGFSIAACELAAERRWAVTGTPVQNRLDDLGSLIKFLRIKPFDSKGAFAQYILAPFKTADPEILPKLRLLVDSITLRRLKENIDLPPRKDSLIRLEFTKEERELYKVFVADSKSKVQLLTSGERMGGRSYAHILKSIMRLRLICAHGEELLSDEDRKLLEGLTKDKAIDLTDDDDNDERPRLSKKQAFEMLELLRQSNLDDCPRCGKKIGNNDSTDDEEEVKGDTNTIGHMTACYHVVCPDCWPQHEEEVQQQLQDQILKLYEEGEEDPNVNTYTCPYCRQEGTKMDHEALFQTEVDAAEAEKARIRANPKLARQMGFYRGPHTKTLKLVEYLKKYEAESHSMPEEAPIKSVVFSGWTTHLDLIQIALTANNITYTRLDGSMTRKSRAAAIETFTSDPATTVILITIGAGGLGLNLTAGSKVFVMEPQFNPAAEMQAVDRVHRLGQTREVEIMRFIMRDSFEENMLAQQEKKIELADLTVNRNRKMDRAEAAKAKLESLKSLFR